MQLVVSCDVDSVSRSTYVHMYIQAGLVTCWSANMGTHSLDWFSTRKEAVLLGKPKLLATRCHPTIQLQISCCAQKPVCLLTDGSAYKASMLMLWCVDAQLWQPKRSLTETSTSSLTHLQREYIRVTECQAVMNPRPGALQDLLCAAAQRQHFLLAPALNPGCAAWAHH